MSTTSNHPDPVEAEIEHALDPGRFVSDQGCFRFVDGLEQVAAAIGRLVTNDPERAAASSSSKARQTVGEDATVCSTARDWRSTSTAPPTEVAPNPSATATSTST